MAATPYPTDYVYAGNAVALTLKTAVSDGGGDLTLTVNEETAAKGWPSLGAGQRFVIVVGRGTAYETKYAVKTITSSVSGSTLVVDSADKTFDNTPVTAAPAGTVVEHCWSATEASLANDHMRTKQAHGSDGDLVDQNTAQLLSNKTVMTPTASGHPTTKSYVDAADALALPKVGGTMSGPIAMGGNKITGLAAGTANGDAVRYEQINGMYLPILGGTMSGAIAMGSNKITGLAAATANGDAVRYEQISTMGVYSDWTPAVTATANPTTYTSTGRYTQIGKRVSGWGRIVGFAYAGSGAYQLSLPVTPATTSGYTRLGIAHLYSTISGPNHGRQWQLELNSGKAQPIREQETSAEDADTLVPFKYMTGGDVSIFVSTGTVYIEYQFDYEAA